MDEPLRDGEKIANEHWEWMKNFIGEWAEIWGKAVEQNYKEGFIHGFKHGAQSTNDSLEKVVCELHNKIIDLEKKVNQ